MCSTLYSSLFNLEVINFLHVHSDHIEIHNTYIHTFLHNRETLRTLHNHSYNTRFIMVIPKLRKPKHIPFLSRQCLNQGILPLANHIQGCDQATTLHNYLAPSYANDERGVDSHTPFVRLLAPFPSKVAPSCRLSRQYDRESCTHHMKSHLAHLTRVPLTIITFQST